MTKAFLISFETIESVCIKDNYPYEDIVKHIVLTYSDTYEGAISKIKESEKYSKYVAKKTICGEAIRNFQNNTIQ